MGATLVLGAVRVVVSAMLASGVTLSLFFVMHRLVAMGEAELKESVKGRVVDFVRVKHETPAVEKKREVPDRPEQAEAPPPAPLELGAPTGGDESAPLAISAPEADVGLDLKGPEITAPPSSDAEAAPLVRVEPEYPRQAAAKGIEGWVRVQFDIGTSGQVKNARVVGAEPPRIFDKAAVRAVEKWRYRPTVKGGRAIEKRGVIVRLTFNL